LKKISIVGLGDLLLSMKLSIYTEPDYLEMVKIINEADAAVANLETLLHNYEDNAYPSAESGGSWAKADPSIVEELRWLGVDIVSTANNHSLDYMYGGLLNTIEYLKKVGIKFAGTGRNLTEARKPTYFETPKGRVGLIAAASTFANFGRAGLARRDLHGRPGLNPLRYKEYIVIKEKILFQIKKITSEIGLISNPGENKFFGKEFIEGEEMGIHTQINKCDMEGNLEAIREAKRQADWVIFSLHCHERYMDDNDRPAEFIEEFARASIDEGAHMFLGHGPHVLRGIEIREGKPIFYSLGNFVYQNFTIEKLPADFYMKLDLDPYKGTPADVFDAREKTHHAFQGDNAYKRWISIIPYTVFEGDKLIELKIIPVRLGKEKPRSQRGRPILARNAEADKILQEIKSLSAAYGTDIIMKNGVGYVKL